MLNFLFLVDGHQRIGKVIRPVEGGETVRGGGRRRQWEEYEERLWAEIGRANLLTE